MRYSTFKYTDMLDVDSEGGVIYKSRIFHDTSGDLQQPAMARDKHRIRATLECYSMRMVPLGTVARPSLGGGQGIDELFVIDNLPHWLGKVLTGDCSLSA